MAITQVKLAVAVGIAIDVFVGAIFVLVEDAITVVTGFSRTRIEVVTCTFLLAAFIRVTLDLCTDVAIVFADDIRVDAGV